MDDTLEVLALAEAAMADYDEHGALLEGATERRRGAFAVLHRATKRLAATSLEALKADGLETSFNDGDPVWCPVLGCLYS